MFPELSVSRLRPLHSLTYPLLLPFYKGPPKLVFTRRPQYHPQQFSVLMLFEFLT